MEHGIAFRLTTGIQALSVFVGLFGMFMSLWTSRKFKGAEWFLGFLAIYSLFFLGFSVVGGEGLATQISFLWLGREGSLAGARHAFQYSPLATSVWCSAVCLGSLFFFRKKQSQGGLGLSCWKIISFLGLFGMLLSSDSPWSALTSLFFMAALIFLEERESPLFYRNQSAFLIAIGLLAAAFFMQGLGGSDLHTPLTHGLLIFSFLLLAGSETQGSPAVFVPYSFWLLGLILFVLRRTTPSVDSAEYFYLDFWFCIFFAVVLELRTLFLEKFHSALGSHIIAAGFLALSMRLAGVSSESASLLVVGTTFSAIILVLIRTSSAEKTNTVKTEANWPFYLFFAFLGFVTFALPGTTIFQSLLALVARLKENPDPVAWGQVFAALWILSVSTGLFFREVRLQKQKGGLDRSELLFGIPLLTSGFLFLISGNFLGVTGTFWFESGHSRLMGNSEVLDGNEWAIFYGTLVVFSALWMWVAIRYSKNWQGDGGFQSWMKKHWVMQDLETLGEIVLKKLDRVLSWNGFSAGPAMGAFFHRSFYFLGEGLRRFENRTVQGIRSSERVLTEVLPQAFQLPLKGTVSTELVWILGGVLVLILHFGLRLNHG